MRNNTHRPFPDPLVPHGPNSSLSQAYAVNPPRHLAPTVGPAVVLARVKIRTGNLLGTGERVMSGLMQRSGSQHLLFDNTGRLRQAPSIPPIGFRIIFGTVDVLFAVA